MNDSFYREDSGRIDQDAVPLNAMHVKKDVSHSAAQQFLVRSWNLACSRGDLGRLW